MSPEFGDLQRSARERLMLQQSAARAAAIEKTRKQEEAREHNRKVREIAVYVADQLRGLSVPQDTDLLVSDYKTGREKFLYKRVWNLDREPTGYGNDGYDGAVLAAEGSVFFIHDPSDISGWQHKATGNFCVGLYNKRNNTYPVLFVRPLQPDVEVAPYVTLALVDLATRHNIDLSKF